MIFKWKMISGIWNPLKNKYKIKSKLWINFKKFKFKIFNVKDIKHSKP
jgi:hypothetical protein